MDESSPHVDGVSQISEQSAKQGKEQRSRKAERRYRFGPRRRRSVSLPEWWREALLAVLLLTMLLSLIIPFPRIAASRATAAGPVEPLPVLSPTPAADGFCLVGDFQEWDDRTTPLMDDGTEGDQTAGDGLYTRTVIFGEPGRYLWGVLPCGDWSQSVPVGAAWVFVRTPNQPITFTFRTTAADGRFWPSGYVLTADDVLPARLVAVGTFQDVPWNDQDSRTALEEINSELFQVAYRVSRPGTHEAYVVVKGYDEGIGASGRSQAPVPLVFTTQTLSEWVLFQYDGRSDRIAILYQIPGWLGWLAFERGAQIIAALAGLGALVMGLQVVNRQLGQRPHWHHGAGCPDCQGELRRINRTTADYLLRVMGIPVRRYKCSSCNWQGRRLHRRR